MKHANISIFVPHLGCPNDCSFCNQRHITGRSTEPCAEDIRNAVSVAVSSRNFSAKSCEIAFFGGSFTAIDREYMHHLLTVAAEEVNKYGLRGIRISTRPDCISAEILNVLKQYSVTAIELGAQSMDDEVLALNDRGHTSKQVVTASKLIREFGFELGLQMMTGLFGDTDEKAINTALKIAALKPDTIRIYPTIVLKNTRLAALYNEGKYIPQNLDDAVSLVVKLQDIFSREQIKIIRTGLHSIEEESFVAGPWHPAFSELCDSKRFLDMIVSECKSDKSYEIEVNPLDISKAVGQKKANLNTLSKLHINVKFIQNKDITLNTIKVREVNQD